MHTPNRTRAVVATAATAATAALAALALATPASAGLLSSGLPRQGASLAPVQPWLASQLGVLKAATPTTVLVHGTDTSAATQAVQAFGLRTVTTF